MKIKERPDWRGNAGLVTAIICTSLNDGEATSRINAEQPTGISSRWEINPDHPNQREPCDEWPDTHRHLVFHC